MASPGEPAIAARRRRTAVPARPFLHPVSLAIVTGEDLGRLAAEAGLTLSGKAVVSDLAAEMNEALQDACHAAMLAEPRDFRKRAAWCGAISVAADEIADAIMSSTASDGWAPWDVWEMIQQGLPGPDDVESQSRLSFLMTVAVPDKDGGGLEGQFQSVLGRLAPALRAVSLVAMQAQLRWDKRVTRGGKAFDGARHHLMTRLAAVYGVLFGRPPTVSVRHRSERLRSHVPDGQSVRWFKAFFAMVEERLHIEPSTKPLSVLAVDARIRSDCVANWIREVGKKGKSNHPSLD